MRVPGIGYGVDSLEDAVCGAPPWCGYFKFFLTAGIASAQAAASSVPVLYNPAVPTVVGSVYAPLVILRVMAVRLGVVSGSVVAGDIVYGVGSGITFSSASSANSGSFNTLVGRGAATPALWYTTATASSAPTQLVPSGFNAAGALAAGPLFNLTDCLGGSIVIPPGGSFWPFLANGAAAPALTALVTVDVIQELYIPGY